MRWVVLWILGVLLPVCLHAERIISRSQRYCPEWVKKGESFLYRSNDTYEYKIIQIEGKDLEKLKADRLMRLSQYIGQMNQLEGVQKTDIEKLRTSEGTKYNDSYCISFTTHTSTEKFYSRFIAEYWECVRYADGQTNYRYYALYAVSKRGITAQFDEYGTTEHYGIGAMARSIIPGWGQFYKGSTAKGVCFLVGEAALVSMVVAGSNLRNSYIDKAWDTQNTKERKAYLDDANTWKNIRNVCMGAAAALYVYNLIDAVATEGRQRVVVKKNRGGLSFAPVVLPNYRGMSLTYRF